MSGTICVYVSRPQNEFTKPRLFSPLVFEEWSGPIRGFRINIDPRDSKSDLSFKFSQPYIPIFDSTSKEVNAFMCLSSILIGWVFRFTNGIYGDIQPCVIDTILANIRTLVDVNSDDDNNNSNGWTVVAKRSENNTAHKFVTTMVRNVLYNDNWSGIFDVNLYLTTVAIATDNYELIEKIRSRFNSRFQRFSKNHEQFTKETQKFKIFLWLTSFHQPAV